MKQEELKEGWYECYKLYGSGNSVVQVKYYRDGKFCSTMRYSRREDKITTFQSVVYDISHYRKVKLIKDLSPIERQNKPLNFFGRLKYLFTPNSGKAIDKSKLK